MTWKHMTTATSSLMNLPGAGNTTLFHSVSSSTLAPSLTLDATLQMSAYWDSSGLIRTALPFGTTFLEGASMSIVMSIGAGPFGHMRSASLLIACPKGGTPGVTEPKGFALTALLPAMYTLPAGILAL